MNPTFSGELGLIGLFDLGQLLHLNGASGVLTVTTREGLKGYFYFDRGQIVNAVDDTLKEGEGAAYRMFGWKQGHFEFRPETVGNGTIREGTEALMMESARRLDEGGQQDGPAVGPGEADKLLERQHSFEALREAFQTVAHDARFSTSEQAVEAPGGVPLAMLRGAGDRLLYRVGHTPRLLHGGRWKALGDQRLDPAAYDQVRTRLLDGVRPMGVIETATQILVRDGDGCAYTVTLLPASREAGVEETLWIRAAHLVPDPSRLHGRLEGLHELTDLPSGVVVISAPTPEATDQLFHIVVALLAQRRGQSMVLVDGTDTWTHTDAGGALVRVAPQHAREAQLALSPEVLAIGLGAGEMVADVIHAAAFIACAHVSPNATSAVPRWLARHGLSSASLPGSSMGLVFGLPSDAEGRLAFESLRWDLTSATPSPSGMIPLPLPVPSATAAATKGRRESAKPVTARPDDPMRALADELSRQLRKSA